MATTERTYVVTEKLVGEAYFTVRARNAREARAKFLADPSAFSMDDYMVGHTERISVALVEDREGRA